MDDKHTTIVLCSAIYLHSLYPQSHLLDGELVWVNIDEIRLRVEP